MNVDNRVLVVVDPTRNDEQGCVTRGAWLAKKLNVGLDLLICDYEQMMSGGNRFFDTPGLSELRNNVVYSNRERLEEIASPLRDDGINVVVSSVWDTPLDEGIVRHVMRTQPKVVVKETHYHSKIHRAIFHNTDWNLVRLCPEPLWLAKPQDWPDHATILASVDPTHTDDKYSKLDDQILNLATMLADKLGCNLHAFHSYLPPSTAAAGPIDPQLFSFEGIEEKIRASHEESVKALLDGYDIDEQNVHVMAGAPNQLLPDIAREVSAGLVVMGSIARNSLQRVFLGSTSEKVLDRLPCDLIVVKPLWYECPVLKNAPKHYDGTSQEEAYQGNPVAIEGSNPSRSAA